MCLSCVNTFLVVIHSHYDVKPYRKAFHDRNHPLQALCLALLTWTVLTILFGLSSFYLPIDDLGILYYIGQEMSTLASLNRSRIVTDFKEIYPPDLSMSITPDAITANQAFPICFPAPKFLMPLFKSPEPVVDETMSEIDEIKKATMHSMDSHIPSSDIMDSFLRSFNPLTSTESTNTEINTLDIRMEDIWSSLLGFPVDPNCLIRIDQSMTSLLDSTIVNDGDSKVEMDEISKHRILCSNFVEFQFLCFSVHFFIDFPIGFYIEILIH